MVTDVERKALLYQQPLQPSFSSCSGNAGVMTFQSSEPQSNILFLHLDNGKRALLVILKFPKYFVLKDAYCYST